MSQQTKQQIEYTLSTHAIEKLVPSQNALRLCKQMASGSINADSAVNAVLKQHGLKRVRRNG